MKHGRQEQKESEPLLLSPAQITVSRRESKASNANAVWSFFLNGEGIGRIEDFASITVASGKRKNVLTARDAGRALTRRYKFSIKSGWRVEVCFNGGAFTRARRIDTSAGGPEDAVVKDALPERFKSKILEWLYWAGLSGFCAAVFILGLEHIILALVLSFFTVLALMSARISTHKAMVEYLADNYPEVWAEIAREQYTDRVWGPRDLIFVKDACADPEYIEIRKKHKKVFIAQILILSSFFVSYFYFRITFTR